MFVLDYVTETQDFVEALYDALPKNRQQCAYKANTVCAAQMVLQYFNEIDLQQALLNLALNELEDTIIGRLNSAAIDAALKNEIYWAYKQLQYAQKFGFKALGL